MMKKTMAVAGSMFNTVRMTRQYAENVYVPAIARWRALSDNGLSAARALTEWKHKVREQWPRVGVVELTETGSTEVPVGTPLHVRAVLALAGLTPEDVRVELYHGHLEGGQELVRGVGSAMTCVEHLGGDRYRFEGAINSTRSGSHGYSLRLMPSHAMMTNPFETSLVHWA